MTPCPRAWEVARNYGVIAMESASITASSPVVDFDACRAHVLARIRDTSVGADPYFHLFIDRLFPDDFYAAFRAHMLAAKHGGQTQARVQDNPTFTNQRTNLRDCTDPVIDCIRRVFSDLEVKQTLASKFYIDPSADLCDVLSIHHDELEYFYTKAGRLQNIHCDIPPKFMSFVFYVPEHPVSPDEEMRNATIIYDKSLAPHYKARFKDNSVCVFIPHFYSYHGFSSTIDRDVLVMFFINQEELGRWGAMRQEHGEAPPFTGLLDATDRKLREYPLIEYGPGDAKIVAERAACLVNAPQGRVIV